MLAFWHMAKLIGAMLGIVAAAILLLRSAYASSKAVLLYLVTVVLASIAAIYASGTFRLASAVLAVGVGLGGLLHSLKPNREMPPPVRWLRLLASSSCLCVGAIFLPPRFPVTALADRAGWACVGFFAFLVCGVFVSPTEAGVPPREPLGPGREVPIVPWLFDVLTFLAAISVMTVRVLSPQTEAAIAVLLVVVCAGMMSALLQIVFRPLTLLTGMPATGMAWGYLSTMLIGWYASFGTSTSAEAHALGWAMIGAGPSATAWFTFVRPCLVGYRTPLQHLTHFVHGN